MPAFSELLGRYASLAKAGSVFSAYATVTAPVIYSTAAGTGGPLLWNGTTNQQAHILAVTAAVTTASTVAGALGFTVGSSQVAAPTSTTAIDASGCTLSTTAASGKTPVSRMNVYRIGTVTTQGATFTPLFEVGTGAITADKATAEWVDVGGIFVIAPNTWGSVTASATLSTAVMSIGLLWAEFPVDGY